MKLVYFKNIHSTVYNVTPKDRLFSISSYIEMQAPIWFSRIFQSYNLSGPFTMHCLLPEIKITLFNLRGKLIIQT